MHVYENQRWNPLTGFTTRGLPTDRYMWSDETGREKLSKDSIKLQTHWQWVIYSFPSNILLVESINRFYSRLTNGKLITKLLAELIKMAGNMLWIFQHLIIPIIILRILCDVVDGFALVEL